MYAYQQHVEAVPELVLGEDDDGEEVAHHAEDSDGTQQHALQPKLHLEQRERNRKKVSIYYYAAESYRKMWEELSSLTSLLKWERESVIMHL